ncbi:nuclear transcription factor Y subunit B-3 [Amborella trichopoda]|uniref:Transcription factor CBF/NF-Y/archaeal histone domain-containing protein n=1 Tax=Amborella trichopoda TaxID=13333 RepID=W1NEW4_AMBTC|nr:nuclear transcription factor Y subunit B-3 [Amborella trichopoda]ERM94322.1 hypothetical protein AMTR_s00010p00239530 [Amborella trichopoda]|eukprot:XP_006827085.1 nuclear transcription factor Y subunit B-3 [Amborella trichopoda]
MTGRRSQLSPDADNPSRDQQERLLPIANVGRIMKRSLPSNAKISKDAKETVQECASEFISFVTGEASDKCLREKRKTINGDDLIWAMTTLGFENYVAPLKAYLNKYRDIEGERVIKLSGGTPSLVFDESSGDFQSRNGEVQGRTGSFQGGFGGGGVGGFMVERVGYGGDGHGQRVLQW